jgi:sugar lactone lactonase YvrE
VYDTLTTGIISEPVYPIVLGGAFQKGTPLVFATPAAVTPFVGGSQGFSNISSAGGATFNRPIAVTTDGTNLYVADYMNNAIRQINIGTKHVTTIAGNTSGLAGSTDGTGTAAFFNRPNGITIDGKNNLYVTDSGNFTVRKIDLSSKAVTTLAGAAGSAGSVDSTTSGTNARFNVLNGITTDGISLFVTDSNNTVRRIVIASGIVTTVAGTPGTTGSADGVQAAARFNLPARITTDGPNLYVTDFNNNTIRKIALANGAVTTIAGKVPQVGEAGSNLDSTDNGLNARFHQPNGITCDGKNLYVTDSYDNTVRRIVLSSASVASGPVDTLTTIVTAPPNAVLPNSTVGITTDGTSLYVTDFTADTVSHTIRIIQ